MNFPVFPIAFALGGVLSTTAVSAATVTIDAVLGTPMITQSGIRADTATRGTDLAGMVVRAVFGDGTISDLTWQAYDPYTNGGTTTTGFSLAAGWNGFHLETTRQLSSLTLFGATGNALFDILPAYEGEPGNTPTTKNGYDFDIKDGDPGAGEIGVTYSDAVTLAGTVPGADAFATMRVDFTGLSAGGFTGFLHFTTDLDSLAVAGDLVPAAVPLPAGMPLLLGGLGVLAVARRRRTHGD